VLGHRTWCH